MKVWVVEHGEMHEGGSIDGIFLSRESALKCAEAFRVRHSWCRWDGGDYAWFAACDWLTVKEWEVQP